MNFKKNWQKLKLRYKWAIIFGIFSLLLLSSLTYCYWSRYLPRFFCNQALDVYQYSNPLLLPAIFGLLPESNLSQVILTFFAHLITGYIFGWVFETKKS